MSQIVRRARVAARKSRRAGHVALTPSERWRIELRALDSLDDPRSSTGKLKQPAIDLLVRRLLRAMRHNPQAVVPIARGMRRHSHGQSARDVIDSLWENRAQTSAEWSLACALAWYETRKPQQGDTALAHAFGLSPDWVRLFEEQARQHSLRRRPELAAEAARRVIALHGTPKATRQWSEFLGNELLASGHYGDALRYLKSGEPQSATGLYWYRRALCSEESGEAAEARECYLRAGRMRLGDVPATLRTPALHYSQGAIPRAVDALKEMSQGESGTQVESERLLLLGRSLLRLEEAKEAVRHLRSRDRAADSAPVVQVAALAEELAGHLGRAVEEYRLAIEVHGLPLHHRLARVLHGLGRTQEAVDTWIESTDRGLALDDLETEADPDFLIFQSAVAIELSRGDYELALPGLKKLAGSASSAKNVCQLHQTLGHVLTIVGQPDAALTSFMRASDALVAHASEAESSFAPIGKYERYAAAYETLPLDQGTVLYEAFQGAQASCNPLTLCQNLLRERPDLHHVWAISPGAPIHDSLRNHPHVSFVRIHSDGYRLHLATAATLITNNSFPRYFVRREGQRYLNTWHGFPWKSLGRDIVGNSYSYSNLARNLLQATLLAFPDDHTAHTMTESNDVAGLLTARVVTGGQPRVDRTLTMAPQEKRDLRRRLGLFDDRPVVLYAPTWRGSIGSIDTSVDPYLRAITAMTRSPDAQVVLSVHHLVASQLTFDKLPDNVVVVPPDVDTNELLSIVDILISDYSSVIFDFAALGRPIIKYVFDHEQYNAERGLYFGIEDVPGTNCINESELAEALNHAISSPSVSDWSDLPTASAWLGDDGHVADRVLAALFDESESGAQADDRRVLLAAAHPVSTDIGADLGSLMAEGSTPVGHLQLMVPKSEIDQPENALTAAKLHRVADFTLTMEQRLSTRRENLAWARLEAADQPLSGDLLEVIRIRLQRERRRIFGSSKFTQVIDFGGQGLHGTSLLALGFHRDTLSVHVLKGDGDSGRTLHGPLEPALQVLPQFDVLGSENDQVCAVNRRRLSEHFSVPTQIHQVMTNPLAAALPSTDAAVAVD